MRHNFILLILIIISFSCNNDSDTIPSGILNENIDTEFFSEKEVEIVFENDIENGINVIFLGDGYLKKDLGKTYGAYKKDAHRLLEKLFETPPFSEYTNYFNVYIVYAESPETATTLFDIDQNNLNTAFSISNNFGFNYDSEKTLEYAQKAVLSNTSNNVDLILMATNYGINGRAYLGDIAFFDNNNESTMLHEVGHAFGLLGDEYNNNFSNPSQYPNLDNTDNLDEIKWSHFIDLENYDNVGAFYRTQGWIPENYSLMGNNDYGVSFNAPSREAIVKRIFSIRDVEYDFNSFLEIDLISLDAIQSMRQQTIHDSKNFINCSH